MGLPEFGVKRPVANLMIFCVIMVLAFYSLTRLGVDMMPEIEPPAITVISTYPGASAEDVEIKVTEPLENQLSTTPGIEKITSRSMEGASLITLKFQWGTDMAEASNDIRDRIELTKRYLPDIPDEMENPFIFKFNTSNIPIMYMGVVADQSYADLYDIIDKKVGDALRQLPGVGTVQLQGGLERQINIWIDRSRLEGYGFSILDIKAAIRRENVTQPLGNIKTGRTDYLVRLPGEFASPDEINHIILGQKNGQFVFLKDVARVEDGFKEVTTRLRFTNKPGLIMMVQKQSGTNTVEVASMLKKRLAELQKELPADIQIYTIFDTSKDVITALNELKKTLWIGVVLVLLVVLFFLRHLSASFIIAMSIPFSLLIAFIYLFMSGKTINTISLSSLAIATGLVVDDAIVVVDNITRHMERGQRQKEAAIFGTSEIFMAVSASTLTTVVVFLPMLFISGVVGIMFGELAAIITVTLVASLFTATTFIPMLSAKWLKAHTVTGPAPADKPVKKFFSSLYVGFFNFSEGIFKSWEEAYAKALKWCLAHKKTVIFGFLGAFILSFFLTRFIGNEFIPAEDTGDIRISISLNLGTRLEETDKIAKRVETILKTYAPEAQFYYVRSGETSGLGKVFGGASGTHVVVGGAKLIPKLERKRSVAEVGQAIRQEVQKIPGIIKLDVSTGNQLGQIITGGGGKSIQVEIIGHSFDATNEVAHKIKSIMESVPGTVDASISREINRPELSIEVDREKAISLGLDMNTIASTLKTFIEGSSAAKYREKGETYDINVRLDEKSRAKIEDIENLSVLSPASGEKIMLSSFAKVHELFGPVEIERQNRERVIRAECNVYKRSAGKVGEDIMAKMKKIAIPSDIMINFGGEAEEQVKAFKDLFLLLILGLILVYMVMASQFESLLDPFIIMFAVPFTFTGVFLALFLTGSTLSVMTFLGIIMLMGIVVKNAIVLISYVKILRARGYSMVDAITQGGKDRLRPVVMTTLTTFMGLLPMALSRGEGSESWQPLGITMIGGLTISSFITMLFVPTLYAVVENKFKREPKGK